MLDISSSQQKIEDSWKGFKTRHDADFQTESDTDSVDLVNLFINFNETISSL